MKRTQPRSDHHETQSCPARVGKPRQRRGYARPELLRGEDGIALLIALSVILILSGLALSMAVLTTSRTQLAKTMVNQSEVYYAALAGLEEARGRLDSAAPDALSAGSLPTAVNQVVYLVNGTFADLVQPTDSTSRYYDTEYAREFPGGLVSAIVLPAVSSDQPGVGTVSAIPYKWVRITLKTEYSSGLDINQDGTLDTTSAVYWDGAHQNLTGTGVPVYKLTALAVEASGIRQVAQVEVAGRVSAYSSLGGLATGGMATLTGITGGTGVGRGAGMPNLVVNGIDVINAAPCGPTGVPGLVSVGTASISTTLVNGIPVPTQRVASLPSSPAAFINSLRGVAAPILSVDPAHVSVVTGAGSYTGTNVVLGVQASGTTPAQPAVVYSNQSLAISGSNSTGDGILLVSGNLSITGGFSYRGLIVVDGSVTLTSDTTGSVRIAGSVVSSGNLSADSTQSAANQLTISYDSCGLMDSLQSLPRTVLAFRLP